MEKKLKTYAEAIGIKENYQNKEIEKNKGNGNQSENKKGKDKKLKQEMEEVIEKFQFQIKELKDMIVFLCNTIVKDDNIKETMLKKMEHINNIEIKEKKKEHKYNKVKNRHIFKEMKKK